MRGLPSQVKGAALRRLSRRGSRVRIPPSAPQPNTGTFENEVLAKYMNYLLCKKCLKHTSIKRKVVTIKSLLRHGVKLSDPDTFVKFLNTTDWASGTKDAAVDSYRDYLNMIGLTEVKLPHIRREDKLPFIPLEPEIDAIIHSVRTKTATFLRLLKDTGCRPVEAWSIKWSDIELTNRCVSITGVKYSNSRKLKLSEQTLNMLYALPKNNQYVFSKSGNKTQDCVTNVNIRLEGAREPVSFRCNKKLWKAFVQKIKHESLSTCHVLEPFILAYVTSIVYVSNTNRPLIENFVIERAVKRVRRYEKIEEVMETIVSKSCFYCDNVPVRKCKTVFRINPVKLLCPTHLSSLELRNEILTKERLEVC